MDYAAKNINVEKYEKAGLELIEFQEQLKKIEVAKAESFNEGYRKGVYDMIGNLHGLNYEKFYDEKSLIESVKNIIKQDSDELKKYIEIMSENPKINLLKKYCEKYIW